MAAGPVNVTVTRYILGLAALLLVCGSLAAAAVALRRRFFTGWSGALARLVEAVIGLTLLIAILELLGTVGLFRLGPITVACVAVGVGVWLRRPRELGTAPARSAISTATAALAAVALLAVAVVYAEWASPTLQAYDVGVHVLDSLWYHLPWAASIAQTGQLTPLRFTDVEFLTPFYPATGEMLHGLGIVLLGRDTLSPAFNLLWLGLALLAAYCIGRDRGRGAAAMCGVALVLATPMMYVSQPGGADNDNIGVVFLLSAVALLVGGDQRREAYVLAAIAAGIAASIKLTLVVPVALLTVGVLVTAPRGRRRSSAALWLGPQLLAGGFWYARNLIAVGNPLPFASFGILPTPAAPLEHNTGYAIVHYLTDGRVWSKFAEPAFASGLGGWWYVILALALAGPILCLLPGASARLRMVACVALASLAAYLVTPESAAGPQGDPVGIAYNVRYAAPALALSLALLALAPVLGGVRRQLGVILGLVVVLAVTVAEPGLWPARHIAGAIALGAVVLAVGLLGLAARVAQRRGGRARPQLRTLPARALVLAAVTVLLSASAAAGYAWQRHYLRGRYAFKPHVSYLAQVWAFFRSVHDARVGVVGTFGGYFAYPLFGLDDSDRVQYIAHRGPHGSFTPITSCRQWREAVNAAHISYLVTTPERNVWRPKRLTASPELAWTASDPSAELVYERVAASQPIAIFRLRGPLDPSSCP
jgi:hypothetical protein